MSAVVTPPGTTTVAVDGGDLTVGLWGPADPAAPTVVAVHGITASHRCWPAVAHALPGVRVIAPDLRGRGRSADLPAPYGMAQHAADVGRVVTELAEGPVVVVGHSMGGFVGVHVAAAEPDRVRSLVLVDGGLPLPAPPGGPPRDAEAALGPAGERLRMTFTDREAYRDFWRVHPAFAGEWNATIQGYVDYDLRGTEPELRSSSSAAAVGADTTELFGHPDHLAALAVLAGQHVPVTFLRARRGLLDEPTGLYPAGARADGRRLVPELRWREVTDVNHYTIVMADRGAAAVAETVMAELRAPFGAH